MSAKFEAPEHIVDCVEQYKESGEKYNIFNAKILVNKEYYYYAAYLRGATLTGHIVMKEDGSLPFLEDIQQVLLIGREASSLNEALYSNGKLFMKMKHERFMKKPLQLL